MALTFSCQEITFRESGLTFDDVLLMPRKSEVRSRLEPSLATRLTANISLEMPFISANMDTVTGSEMAIAMSKLGAIGILHRFMSVDNQVEEVKKVQASGAQWVAASIGVNSEDRERAKALIDVGVNLLTIDIAHGHSVAMLETLEWLKTQFPDVQVIAGNVASREGAADLAAAGADAIKAGIGPGSMCTTRLITGCGVPQLTAIALCVDGANGVPIIADGGLRTSGDIVKAFAAGASTVMLGSLLAGTIETPGAIRGGKKEYRGMASKSAQVSWRGGVPKGMAAEGESTKIAIKGHVSDVIAELAGGVRSGMSYLNADKLTDIPQNALFMGVSAMSVKENRAHGLP